MDRRGMLKIMATAVPVALLGACYEPPDVTLHKPGVYKGGKDPLLAKQRQADQQERLVQRFNLGQLDR